MNIGHFDFLDEHGSLRGWFLSDEISPTNDTFAVLQANNLLAIGRRSIERPDVYAHHSELVVGFNLKLVPTTTPLLDDVPLTLTVSGSASAIRMNKFLPTGEWLNSENNSQERVRYNADLVDAISKNWLFSDTYITQLGLNGYSNKFVAIFYLCMKEYWPIATNEWINIAHLSEQLSTTNFADVSPLEALHSEKNQAVSPNSLFDSTYVSGRLFAADETASRSSAEILRRWMDALDEGVLIRPSAMVRGRFDSAAKFIGSRKARIEFLAKINALIGGSADFETLSSLIPVFDARWLKTRPVKASENGSTFLHKVLHRLTDLPPNPFIRSRSGLDNYKHCCERFDAGETVALTAINPSLSDSVKTFTGGGDMDVDRLAEQLRAKAIWRSDKPSIDFIEKLFPGITSYLAKKAGVKSSELAYKIYLEQLGIPPSIAAIDLSSPPPGFSVDKFHRLGQVKKNRATKVSVVIPTYGRIDLLFNLLVSLANSSISTPTEIFVCDDCSGIDVSILGYFFPNVNFLNSAHNRGFLRNVNEAISSTHGEYLVIANNDLLVQREALDELVRPLVEDSKTGVVGGLVLSSDGTVQECAGAIWADGTAWNLFRGQAESNGMPKNVREADYISGCWLATRRSTWDSVGGFSDELAPAYCEDMDYCLKVRQLGQRVIVNPHSRVTHLEGQTMGTDVTSKVDGKRYQDINQRKVFAKWHAILPTLYAPNGSLSLQFRGYKHLKPFAMIYDHYCPEPDRDAGSKTVFEFIKAICDSQAYYPIFVPMNNNYSKYSAQLEKMGVEVIHGSGWSRLENLLTTMGEHVGLTLCSRLSVARHFQWHIQKSSGKKLVYIHDVEEVRHATAWGLNDSQNLITTYQKHVSKWQSIYEMFDQVVTCSSNETENLADKLRVPIFTVPPYQEPRDTVTPLPSTKCEMLFIGSVNHTPNLVGIEWFVNSVFPYVRQNFPDATLHLAGSGFETCAWLQRAGVMLHGQVSENTLKFLYSKCNISVAPLLEGAGVKGKVVEALAQGRPCLGTDIAYQGMEDLLNRLPAHARNIMSGSADSLAARIVKCCQSQPLSGQMLQKLVAETVGKVNPGVALMQIVFGDESDRTPH